MKFRALTLTTIKVAITVVVREAGRRNQLVFADVGASKHVPGKTENNAAPGIALLGRHPSNASRRLVATRRFVLAASESVPRAVRTVGDIWPMVLRRHDLQVDARTLSGVER